MGDDVGEGDVGEEDSACKDNAENDVFAWAPIGRLIGLEVQPGSEGVAEVYLNVDERMHNPMGFVHGGVIALLADACMGVAFGRSLVDPLGFATIETKVNFLRPVTAARLLATAHIVSRGLRIGFVEARIVDQRQRLVATASCTCTVNTV